jgi:excisionase family DNA binding protein
VITQATNIISDSMETPVAQERAGIRLLTPEDVAALFSVDKRTVLKWGRDGKLERVKISGRVVLFTPESVNIFVKSKTQGVESVTAPNPKPRERVQRSITKKGGLSQSSRKSSWRSLREEVTKKCL